MIQQIYQILKKMIMKLKTCYIILIITKNKAIFPNYGKHHNKIKHFLKKDTQRKLILSLKKLKQEIKKVLLILYNKLIC